jgi:hypothetical protein
LSKVHLSHDQPARHVAVAVGRHPSQIAHVLRVHSFSKVHEAHAHVAAAGAAGSVPACGWLCNSCSQTMSAANGRTQTLGLTVQI